MPAAVDRADADAWVADQLAEPCPASPPSWCTRSCCSTCRSTAAGPGRRHRARRDGPRTGRSRRWLRMEPGGDQAELRLTTWPGDVTRLLATSSYHGPPVRWLHRR